MSGTWLDDGRSALTQLEHIVEEHPQKISEAMAEAVGRVVRLRDRLIDERRQGDTSPDGKARLDRANGILSLLVGVEYPVKSIHWKSVCEARDAMKDMLPQA
jgi:hypothetical protein